MIHINAKILSTLAIITLLLITGCGSDEAAQEAGTVDETSASTRRQVRVETLSLEPTSFEDVIEITGAVQANNDATVSAQGSGTLVYHVARGTYVGRNGLIARIDSTLMHAAFMQAKAQVEVAQAQYNLAHDSFERQEPLYQDSIISAIEFETIRAQMNQATGQLNQAKAAMAQVQEQLDNTSIRAPFSGTVETLFVEMGEQVTPGMQIARIVNTNLVKVSAGVPERYANDIKTGSKVTLGFDTYDNARRVGTVKFVGKAINPNNRTFPVEIHLENKDQVLKPEMVARLFLTRETFDDVIVIPQDAVPLDEEGSKVFVVVDQGSLRVAEKREVTLGPSYGGLVVVEEGLNAGDEIVVLGQYNLTEGDAVEVVNEKRTTMAALTTDD